MGSGGDSPDGGEGAMVEVANYRKRSLSIEQHCIMGLDPINDLQFLRSIYVR